MAAGKFSTIGKDRHMVWKATTAMEEVGKGGTQHKARSRRRNFCAKKIGLAGLEGEQHGRGMELVVDGPSVQREMAAFPKTVRSAFALSIQERANSGIVTRWKRNKYARKPLRK